MKNAIVILNYNDSENTLRLTNSIKEYSSIQDIVIVDNCSTDGSYDRLLSNYQNREHIHVLKTDKNGGYAYGNNYGCKYAVSSLGAECITVANPDIEFEDATLKALVDFAGTHSEAGCIAPYMLCEKRNQSPMAWRLPSYFDCLIESTVILGRWYRKRVVYSDEYLKSKATVPVDVVAGSFFVIRSEVLEECGWLDEDTFLYYEENILASKLKKIEKISYILGNYSYMHHSSESINGAIRNIKKKLRIANQSRCVYLKKCCNKRTLILNNICSSVGIYLYGIIKRSR